MKKSTITDLPADIEAVIPVNERTPLINKIITEAKAGEFHDYKNKKYVCGKLVSTNLLAQTNDHRLQPIINDIMNGLYDEEADAEDIAMMRAELKADGMTDAQIDAFIGK